MAARLASTIAALAFVVAAAGCSEYTPRTPGPGDGSKLDFSPKATLTIDDTGLHPAQVSVGEPPVAVEVVNRGTRADGITSGQFASDSTEGIDTGWMQPGESTTVYLTNSGTVDVHSRADPSHTAQILVAIRS